MYNLNIFWKKKNSNCIIVIIFNCVCTYARGYTLVFIKNQSSKSI